jgi:hypothetical protein
MWTVMYKSDVLRKGASGDCILAGDDDGFGGSSELTRGIEVGSGNFGIVATDRNKLN